jgi:hypothetical protein
MLFPYRYIIVLFLFLSTNFASTVAVQGVLRDPLGRTVENGNYSISFIIYSDSISIQSDYNLWSETHSSVEVQHGVFSVELGTINPMTDLSFTDQYWVGVTVQGGLEMSPRTKLTTSPYSKAVFGTENIFPSVGNIGVGTTEPNAVLHIIDNIANSNQDFLKLQNSNNQDQLVVQDDGTLIIPADGGAIGIGTENPEAVIHIESSDDDVDMILLKDATETTRIQINSQGDMTIDSDLILGPSGKIIFQDGALVSAYLSGSATGLDSPSDVFINADSNENLEGDIEFQIGGTTMASISNNGNANFLGDATVDGTTTLNSTLNIAGDVSVSGTVDGRDLATDGSKLDGIASGATNVTNNNQLTNGRGFITSTVGTSPSFNTITMNNMSSYETQQWEIGTPYYTDNTNDGGAATQLKIKFNENNQGFSDRAILLGGNGGQGWAMSSDRRLKQNITNYSNALERILRIRPVTYQWKAYPDADPFPGFIAQEVQEIFPEFVNIITEKGGLGVNYGRFIVPVIKAIQDQQEIIEKQGKDIQALLDRVEALEAKN